MEMTFKKIFALSLVIAVHFKIATTLYAQSLKGQRLTDSLQHSLLTAKEDTNKIKTLYRLAWAYTINDSATAFNYANKCLSLSKKINWQKGVGLSYSAMASALYNVSNFNTSIQYSTAAYNIFKSINSKKDIGAAL
ncbi:MAG: hypothetical protein ABJB05_16410, partial [Parafilimonas sp.]